MALINYTKNVEIAANVELAGTWVSRLKGLLGRDKLANGHCLIINPCNSIHTCFMRFNIDVLFLDKKGVVLHLMEDVPPFRFSSIVRGAAYVVELPAGTISCTHTGVHDKININDFTT